MGSEAKVRARVAGKPDVGRALLESQELVFRGAARQVVPLDSAARQAATVSGKWLRIGPLELELGAEAARAWLTKIRNPKSVLEKLGVKPTQRVALLKVRDRSFAEQLARAGIEVVKRGADVVFFEVQSSSELAQLRQIRKELPDHGALWLLRPKGSGSPVAESASRAAARAVGLVDVKVVAFSSQLSAEKYVVPRS